ncbi:MAG: hypothetical protein AAF713_19960 [Pseudomonadota bacterium]
MTYSDDTLRAFLDGTLPAEARQEVEAAFAADRELERRAMSLDLAAAPVAAAFAGMPGEARLATLAAFVEGSSSAAGSRGVGWQGVLATCGAGLGVGIAAGVLIGSGAFSTATDAERGAAPDDPARDWRLAVAEYQALYVPETVAHLHPDTARLSEELDRAAAKISLALRLEPLAEVASLTLRRAQVLGYDGRPLIQLVYTDNAGQPYALCILRGGTAPEGAMTLRGQGSHLWRSGEHQFLLIGSAEASELAGAADAFRAVF